MAKGKGREPCPAPMVDCYLDPPYADDHHIYHPKNEYTTPTEKQFRGLEENIVRNMCRCLHNLLHTQLPPEKPPVSVMKTAIEAERHSRG